MAGQQHGIVSLRQLKEAGLGQRGVGNRVRSGWLHRVYRGVYAVGHRELSREAEWMAAVRACGDDAVLSHVAAAALWGLLKPIAGPIDVSVPSHNGRLQREGIRLHRCGSLAADPRRRDGLATLVTVRNRIPVTTVPRTIDDLRAAVEVKLYRRAIRQAELRGFALSLATPRDRTRSDLERDFLRLCRRHGLPAPEVNVRIGRWTVDFLWRAERLAVETDSWLYHRGSVAFEDDHARDLDLRARGYATRRFTASQLYGEPERVVADVAAGLAEGTRKG